jgi:hypothetical protein
MTGFASVRGAAAIRARPEAFIGALARRVDEGLLPGAPAERNRYRLMRNGLHELWLQAINYRTSIAIGLNTVRLAIEPDGQVRYTIRYPKWATYAVALGALIGLALIGFFLVIDIHDYIEQHPETQIPGLTVDQNAAVGWGMAIFWGFAWPWLLIALHKKPLRKQMDRIIAEVDDAARGPAKAAGDRRESESRDVAKRDRKQARS